MFRAWRKGELQGDEGDVRSNNVSRYVSWDFLKSTSDRFMKGSNYQPKFLGSVLKSLMETLGAEEGRKIWQESGKTLSDFGVTDQAAFVNGNQLADLFPLQRIEKSVIAMLEADKSDQEIIEEVESMIETVDREVSRCVVKCCLGKICQELGGREALKQVTSDNLIEPNEKACFSKRQELLRRWLGKDCDQSYALFELQDCVRGLEYPPGEGGGRGMTGGTMTM